MCARMGLVVVQGDPFGFPKLWQQQLHEGKGGVSVETGCGGQQATNREGAAYVSHWVCNSELASALASLCEISGLTFKGACQAP